MCQTQSIRYEINMLKMEKTKAMSHVFKFKRLIGEVEETLAQKRKVHRKLAAEEARYKFMRTADTRL